MSVSPYEESTEDESTENEHESTEHEYESTEQNSMEHESMSPRSMSPLATPHTNATTMDVDMYLARDWDHCLELVDKHGYCITESGFDDSFLVAFDGFLRRDCLPVHSPLSFSFVYNLYSQGELLPFMFDFGLFAKKIHFHFAVLPLSTKTVLVGLALYVFFYKCCFLLFMFNLINPIYRPDRPL